MREDSRDPEVSAALRAASPEPPVDAVDWDALHQRIQAQARPLLARPSSTRPLHVLGRWWSRGGLLAGSAAAALLMLTVSGVVSRPGGEDAGLEFRTIEEELLENLPAGARPLLIATIEADAMLDAALFYEAEEW